jgi:hypothetical protein
MGITENEWHVWHGTSGLDPAMIYNDKQDGFMMQFASAGFWGRGIYFADKSAYSCNYSYTPDGTKGGGPGDAVRFGHHCLQPCEVNAVIQVPLPGPRDQQCEYM